LGVNNCTGAQHYVIGGDLLGVKSDTDQIASGAIDF
jgi:hypothetical protein